MFKKILFKLFAFVPTKLPIGMAEFEKWSDEILWLYDMPNNDSTKFALAVQILHLKSDDGIKPKRYFGLTLIKGASSQIASAVMQDCKKRQEEKAKEEQEAQNNAVSVS